MSGGDSSTSGDDFSASSDSSSIIPAHPDMTMEEAVHLFFADGYHYLENIFILFASSDAPPEVKDPILRVLARYLHVVKDAINHQLSLEAAHTCAVNAILGDPVVTKMIEQIMGQSVNQIVAKAVE